jgi:hypothetical protein
LTHTIPTEDPPDAPYVIPLSLHGVTSTFPTKKPTVEEFETLPHLTLTSEDPIYNPYDVSFASEEAALTRYLSKIGDRIGASPPPRRLCSVSNLHSLANNIQLKLNRPSLSIHMTSPTQGIQSFNRTIVALQSTNPAENQFDPQLLARNWGIDLHTAKCVELT